MSEIAEERYNFDGCEFERTKLCVPSGRSVGCLC
jgi:hypothetical protein